MDRRNFLIAAGTSAGSLSMGAGSVVANASLTQASKGQKKTAVIRGAFIYPPTESLRKVGYYSWPGSTFDAEGRQEQYMGRLREMERKLGVRIEMDEKPLDEEASVNRFIADVKKSKPAGLLLIPFKKGHWPHVMRILDETETPSVVLATIGILLAPHIESIHNRKGVYFINSLDNLDAVEYGMRAIKTAHWMRNGRIVNLARSKHSTTRVPHLGTEVLTIPNTRFSEIFESMAETSEVKDLAHSYLQHARQVVEPSEQDVFDAAKTYFVLKQVIEEQNADALMMDCLPGLSRPHKHPPPCMGFMSLRDEGIAAGCQSDLNATLTMMLVQELLDRPSFQQNASMDTEKNHFYGAHCTCASKLFGTQEPSEPYSLRNHAEAGWGCVPRVLWRPGEEATIASYLSGEIPPKLLVYTGTVIGSPPMPPCGGCRTNVEMTINEVDDVCKVKGMHQAIFYGNYAKELGVFCQMFGIEYTT